MASLFIGSGHTARSVSRQQLLGIGEFDTSVAYPAGALVMYEGGIYRFKEAHAAGAWDASEVTPISSTDLFLAGVGDPRIKYLNSANLKEGAMLFYDRALEVYCVVAPEMIAAVLADYDSTRYETNFDTYVGTVGGTARFVAFDDAAANMPSLFNDNVAATSCFYRIEIDNTQAGSITFSAASGNASVASNTISWEADEAMSAIVAKFTAKNTTYITFGALADGTGVGLEIGGYGANTITVTASENCTVIDCSTLAFYASANPAAPAVGGTFNPTAAYTFIDKTAHHNWRGAAAATCLPGKGLVAASSSCIANDGFDYSYRTGVNFAKFKEWASVSGDDTYYDDGEGGTDQSVGHVMRKSRFDTEVTNYTGEDSHRLGMKDYYTHLFNDQTGDYATMRQSYEAKYGVKMQSLYDGYLMSHMIKIDAASGITSTMRGKGFLQTSVKADAMNVNYNYVIIPAYPPEYNAQHYGVVTSEGFRPGMYYHPEPADIGLMFRDDLMAKINANITIAGRGTAITNTMYRGSSADYYAGSSWYFGGTYGCFLNDPRYSGRFRCRPSFALPIPY